jgi:hypothetical protein
VRVSEKWRSFEKIVTTRLERVRKTASYMMMLWEIRLCWLLYSQEEFGFHTRRRLRHQENGAGN